MNIPGQIKGGVFSLTVLLAVVMTLPVWASHLGVEEDAPERRKDRPFFEFKGDYRGEINELKARFRQAFGYELMDLDRGWTADEIGKLHEAFALLPEHFYRIPGLKGFYRSNSLRTENQPLIPGEIYAATFPKITTVYRQMVKNHLVVVQNEQPRIEFYNDLFYLDAENFQNIVHHEMGHIFDVFNGFLSLQADWLLLAGFRIHNLPPLDAKPDGDFLYTLINDPDKSRYAPVSNLQDPLHSRENPMEDFANSVAGYIHYPYFRYTNPERYAFMKERVFQGKEYFPEVRTGAYPDIIDADFKKAIEAEDWDRVLAIVKEAARTIDPEADRRLMQTLQEAVKTPRARDVDHKLAAASCYLLHPDALLLRQEMWVAQRIDPETVLKMPRCGGMRKEAFQERLSKVPMMNVYFYRENGETWLQFLDPVLLVAQARGYQTLYKWRLYVPMGNDFRFAARGETDYGTDENGSVRISLNKTYSLGPEFKFPENRMVRLELWAERKHPRFPRVFTTERTMIQVVLHPWFDYFGPTPPNLHIVFPPEFGRTAESVK